MRLNAHELKAIKQVAQQASSQGALYLFGSRLDDARKGGDIDLYFEPKRALNAKDQAILQYQLIIACASHVDLLVKNPGQTDTEMFKVGKLGVLL